MLSNVEKIFLSGTIVAEYIFFATGFFESAMWVRLVEKCIFSLENTFFLLLGRKTHICDTQAGAHRIDHYMKVSRAIE